MAARRLARVALGLVALALATSAAPVRAAVSTDRARPRLPAITFDSVACTSATTCVAVGGTRILGRVATSPNAGRSWVARPLPTNTSSLFAVSCPTTRVCWAGGTVSLVRSTTGGATWTTVPVTTLATRTGLMSDLACSSTVACLLGLNSEDKSTPAILRTVDAGRHWATSALPAVVGTSAHLVTSLQCARPSLCQATVQVGVGQGAHYLVLLSTDGGRSWHDATKLTPDATFFGSCSRGVGCQVLWPSRTSYMFSRTANGQSWTSTPVPSLTAYLGIPVCTSAAACELVGTTFAPPYRDHAYRTTNGGGSWSPQPLPSAIDQRGAEITSLAAPSPNTLVGLATTPAASFAVWTTNAGASWSRTSLP